MFWVRTGLDKLKAWVSGEAGEYDWDEAHAKYLSFLTPGPFQRAVAGGDVELVREMLARRRVLGPRGLLRFGGRRRRAPAGRGDQSQPGRLNTIHNCLRWVAGRCRPPISIGGPRRHRRDNAPHSSPHRRRRRGLTARPAPPPASQHRHGQHRAGRTTGARSRARSTPSP